MTTQITVLASDELATALDAAAVALGITRDEVICQAVEQYLEDFDDLSVAAGRLQDPADPVLDWNEVRHELLGSD